jgi:hypothetical protein
MENPMNNDAQFTDKRLASLREPDDFAPSAVRARRMVMDPPRATARQWIMRAAIAAAILLVLLALPAVRTYAQENPDGAFAHAINHLEWFAAAHWHLLQRLWSD